MDEQKALEEIVGKHKVKKTKSGLYVVEEKLGFFSSMNKHRRVMAIGGAMLYFLGGSVAANANDIDVNSGLRIHEDISLDQNGINSELLASYKINNGLWLGVDFLENGSSEYGFFLPKLGDVLDVLALGRSVGLKGGGIDDFHAKLVLHTSKTTAVNFGRGELLDSKFMHFGYDLTGKNSGFGIGYLKRETSDDELRGYAWRYDENSGLLIGAGKYNDEGRLVLGSPSDENSFGIRGILKYNVETYSLFSMVDFTTSSELLTKTTTRALLDDDLHHTNSFGALEKQNPFNYGPLWTVPSLERLGNGINGRLKYIGDKNAFDVELLTYLGDSPWWMGINLKTADEKFVKTTVEGGYNIKHFGIRLEGYNNPQTNDVGGRLLLETRF